MKNSNDVSWSPMPRFLLRKDVIRQALKTSDLRGKRVLEVGFGSGEMLAWLLDNGAIVSGVDFSPAAHDLIRDRMGGRLYESGVVLYEKLQDVPLAEYDYVFAFEVLEHIVNDVDAYKSWMGLLKQGGELLISVPAHMAKWGDNDVWAGHVKRYERDELYLLAASVDAVVLRLWNYGFPIILALDVLLNLSARKKNSAEVLSSDINKTKRSGVVRSSSSLVMFFSREWVMLPFFFLQRVFFDFDLGSGYLLHVKKNK